MADIDITTVIKGIQTTKKIMENAPPLINAANHIVTNGIRTGGYDVMASAFNGIMQNPNSLVTAKDMGSAAFQGLRGSFYGSGSLTSDITTLGRNVQSRFVVPKAAPTVAKPSITNLGKATDTVNHAITESASSGVSSAIGAVGSAAAKGGIAGIAIGITTETIALYKKHKNGEISKEEYLTEVVKSGAEMGITGAATAGIMTAISVPISAAAPVTIPISIILGKSIDKIIAPAFGRGDYQKILGEAKYYQNLMYAHDDLVHAIEMTENQFGEFIDEYERQMQVHAQLTDTNMQLKQLHTVADAQIEQQIGQSCNSLGSLKTQSDDAIAALGDLYHKI